MSEQPEQPKEVAKTEENKPKEECCKEKCKGFPGFGPWGFPMFGKPPCHPHKERKCECGEVIPKRKEGEPKVKVCPKCGKDLPKKCHGFGMRCHKMKKFMKYMHMMKMLEGAEGFGPGPKFGNVPGFFGRPPCTPPPRRGLEVHHYIHFGSPERPPMGPPGFGRPPMGPPGFGRPPMGPPGFGRPPMGPPGFGRPPMGPPGFGRPPMGPPGFGMPNFGHHRHHRHHRHHLHHGPPGPCKDKECKKECQKEDNKETVKPEESK